VGRLTDVDPLENDGGRRFRVHDVDGLYEELRQHAFADLGERPWERDFAVLDPYRNLIWFHE
jgi:hypothetical protein